MCDLIDGVVLHLWCSFSCSLRHEAANQEECDFCETGMREEKKNSCVQRSHKSWNFSSSFYFFLVESIPKEGMFVRFQYVMIIGLKALESDMCTVK